MKLSPISLVHYYLTTLSIKPVDEYSPNESNELYPSFAGADYQMQIQVGELENSLEGAVAQDYLVHLDLNAQPKAGQSFPYAFTIGADAIIRFHGQEQKPEAMRELVSINGTGMLYSALREMLFSLSSRFPYGPLMLPSTNFLDLKDQLQPNATP